MSRVIAAVLLAVIVPSLILALGPRAEASNRATGNETGTVRNSDRPAPPAWIDRQIRGAAEEHDVAYWTLRTLAGCETGWTWDPWAVSPVRYTGGRDRGLFQFHYYPNGYSLIDATPYRGGSPYDVHTAAHAAAWLIARGYGHHWSCWPVALAG